MSQVRIKAVTVPGEITESRYLAILHKGEFRIANDGIDDMLHFRASRAAATISS